MENGHSRKQGRKLNKKVKKAQHIVEKQTGITCTNNVTKNLVICNCGLVNGLSEDIIYHHFSAYGPLEKIIMITGESCAFVSFKTADTAELAYRNINGKLNLAQDDKPLLLSFVDRLPENSNCTNDLPSGLTVIDNFVTEEEEELLLSLVCFDEQENSSTLKHRQVVHYGYEFRYDNNNVDKDKPLLHGIPKECNFLWDRLQKLGYTDNFRPDQLTVNKYQPGQGIPPHIDTHSAFDDPILSLSLSSSIVMEFRHENGSHVPIFLKQRSLLIMSDESRYNWTHGITPRKTDIVSLESGLKVVQRCTRVSFTFRKLLKGECQCRFTKKCDTYLKNCADELVNHSASQLEKIHVHEIYENIADHFSDTRHKPWPNVVDFINSFDVGSVLMDAGCGNGKYLNCHKNVFKVGFDSSASLINLCQEKGLNVITCNCLYIPFRDESVDGVISIAVIHHLANSERRLRAIRELVRVSRINGNILIYVWAKDQCKDQQKSSYLKQDRRNRKKDDLPQEDKIQNVTVKESNITLPIHINRTQFQHQDVLVPWKLKDSNIDDKSKSEKLFLRFYHVFDEGELEDLCKKLDNIEIVKTYYDQGNWCILLKKLKS
ncbi:hypothetical protein RI129_007688 [Pyrocoelia pectoralis]|uniref:tRNA (carboxymethyluridine(34)-5-O)-methyltransferase n=1 Tax=Pyrocoelia pectoralis TaxID=417401 RepID=A0AAN7VBL7_9COLE